MDMNPAGFETARQLWQEGRNLYASLRLEPGVQECDAHIANLHSV
jgi:hypothetical protein